MPNITVLAAATGLSKINRRTALALGASLAAATVSAAASATGNPDADLFRLEAEFNAAMDAVDTAGDKVDEASQRAFSQRPLEPEKTPVPADLMAAFKEMPVWGIGNLDHPVGRAWSEHLERDRRLHEAWATECAEIRRQCGLDAAEAEQSRLEGLAGNIAEQILEVRAVTMIGVLVKLRVHERWAYSDGEVLESIEADIKNIAGVA